MKHLLSCFERKMDGDGRTFPGLTGQSEGPFFRIKTFDSFCCIERSRFRFRLMRRLHDRGGRAVPVQCRIRCRRLPRPIDRRLTKRSRPHSRSVREQKACWNAFSMSGWRMNGGTSNCSLPSARSISTKGRLGKRAASSEI